MNNINFIIAQIIGMIGSGIGFIGNYQDNRSKLLKINILAYTLVLIHYILLTSNELAIALGFVYILKNILFLFLEKKDNSQYLYYIIYPIMILLCLYYFNDWRVDLFAIISLILDVIAKNFVNLNKLRLFSLFSCISWLIFTLQIGTYSGIIVTIIHIIILLKKLLEKTKGQSIQT